MSRRLDRRQTKIEGVKPSNFCLFPARKYNYLLDSAKYILDCFKKTVLNCLLFVIIYQEVWACWHELLLYLDIENKWLNELESKIKATENIQEGTEEISVALNVSKLSMHIFIYFSYIDLYSCLSHSCNTG